MTPTDNKAPREKALHLAAQCWCDDETSSIEMDSRLAMAFAKRYDKLQRRLEKCEGLLKVLRHDLIGFKGNGEMLEKLDEYFAEVEK